MKNIQLLITIIVITFTTFSCKDNEKTLVQEILAKQAAVLFEKAEVNEVLGQVSNVDVATFEKLIKDGQHTLIDVRSVVEHKAGYIEGSINIDWNGEFFRDEILKISNHKGVLVYCASGQRSALAMNVMQKMGFNEVINLNNGFNEWRSVGKSYETLEIKGDPKRLDVENFNNAITLKTGLLLDVRTPEEYATAHLEGATNIDWDGGFFDFEVGKLDKETPLLIYCRSGGRSGDAVQRLEKNGYKVYNLDGGILDWMDKGMKITKN